MVISMDRSKSGEINNDDINNIDIRNKLRLLNGKNFWTTCGIEALDIREVVFSDGPTGLRFQPGENDHLGLNESEKATCFPTPGALACSWDPDLIYEVASCIAREAAEKGVDVLLAPGVNIKRTPLCGRNFEYFSEDPHLAAELGAAYVKGLQENGIGSCIKHFALNNQEAYRMSVDVWVDERALNEIYLKVFREIIQKAKPWAVMAAYNRLLGDYCCENKWLLTDVLRNRWGFDGLVISDWYAVNDIIKSINSGLDLEMPSTGELSLGILTEAYKSGELDKEAVDRAVNNLINLAGKCGKAYKYGMCGISPASSKSFVPGESVAHSKNPAPADYNAHHEIARKAAAKSFVLLKNKKNSLPLRENDRVLCVGMLMQNPVIQGHGSSRVNPVKVDSIQEELSKAGIRYSFEPGYNIGDEKPCPKLAEKAVRAAESCDKIVFFAGLFDSMEAEGYDRENLRLPECQNDLIFRLSKTGRDLVVVLQTGSAVEMPWVGEVDSILQMHLSGQGAGKALAQVLTGKINPCGKLAETYPEKLSHTPAYLYRGSDARVEYGESVFVGYRYYDKKDLNVLFPFGHGLSYTTFEYSDMTVERVEDEIHVSLTVTNTGSYEGSEVVQIYIGLNEKFAIQPVRKLAAFGKVYLKPGESVRRNFSIPVREFTYYDASQKEFVFATGKNMIEAGKSSRCIELRHEINITDSNKKYPPVNRNTPLGILLDIPQIKDIVMEWLSGFMQQVNVSGDEVVNEKELEKSIYYTPLRNAVLISKGGFSYAELDGFIDLLNKKLEETGSLYENT